MTEELEQELRMLGVLDHKTPAVEIDAEPMWVRDDVVFDEDGQPNFQERQDAIRYKKTRERSHG